jgi:hypothetical protein
MNPIGNLVYVASPYTHADKRVQEERNMAVTKCMGWLMNNVKATSFFSPICHAHPIATVCTLPGNWEFWKAYDECMLSRCNEIWILCIAGWVTSTGVNAERAIAKELKIPEKFLIPLESGAYKVAHTEPSSCPVCGTGMVHYSDYLDGHTLLEQYEDCPYGCYSTEFAHGHYRSFVKIRQYLAEFGGSHHLTFDQMACRQAAVELLIDFAKHAHNQATAR